MPSLPPRVVAVVGNRGEDGDEAGAGAEAEALLPHSRLRGNVWVILGLIQVLGPRHPSCRTWGVNWTCGTPRPTLEPPWAP